MDIVYSGKVVYTNMLKGCRQRYKKNVYLYENVAAYFDIVEPVNGKTSNYQLEVSTCFSTIYDV